MKPAAQRYEREPDAHTYKRRPQYQLEMGTKSLLAAFFALAIVCGLFFTFGYTIGKHAIPATFSLGAAKPPQTHVQSAPLSPGVQPPNPQQLGAAETNQTPAMLTSSGAAATSAAAQPATTATSGTTPTTLPATEAAVPTTTAAPDSAAARNIAPPAVAPPTAKPTPASSAPAAATTAPTAANPQNGQLYEVQVFAGTSGDAGSLADALKTRGYPASVISPAPGSGSNLFRVEVGPYLTRAEAQAMRSRLRADGYQAVLRIGQ